MNWLKLNRLMVGLLLFLTLMTGCVQTQPPVTTAPNTTPASTMPTLTSTPESPTLPPAQTAVPPTTTPIVLTPAPQQGITITVTSLVDGSAGSLHHALLSARSGDTITFNAAIFPPTAPSTIYVNSELPTVRMSNLTIDASNAGVILDGSKLGEDFVPCLQITSNRNAVRGLQFINFTPGAGISLSNSAQHT